MDRLDWEYLQENSEILQDQRLPNLLLQEHTLPFASIMEDMDQVGIVHVNEGNLHFAKLDKLPEAEVRRIWGAVFEGEEWKLPEKIPIEIIQARIGIKFNEANHHVMRENMESAAHKVIHYPGNSNKLVIRTLQSEWLQGLGYLVVKKLHESHQP